MRAGEYSPLPVFQNAGKGYATFPLRFRFLRPPLRCLSCLYVIGFDNFFASSIDAVQDIVNNKNFLFYEYDLNNVEQMSEISRLVGRIQQDYARTIPI